MDNSEFRKYLHIFADWMADYFENIDNYPVKSQVQPGEIFNSIPLSAPENQEDMDTIFKDFQNIIMPGITHWQHPNFHAYFPANNSSPSILAEMLTATLGTQCMIWETSPAAAELEEKVMIWLRDMIGLPKDFTGVIQDTASTATLTSILTAREYHTLNKINSSGFTSADNFRVYCSSETHSSIEKAVKIAGIGKDNLVKIPVNNNFEMNTEKLKTAVLNDIRKGFKPLCVIATIGTTGSTAVDDIKAIGEIAREFNLWFHIDAAYAGTALILPEMKHYLKGIEYADTFVFNPHKWMFTNFDCSAYFVKSKDALLRTFEILPEYLKTNVDDHVNNYRDWGIQLGRRFRALKLWFVIRNFGISGIQEKIRFHIELTGLLKEKIESNKNFEILAPVNFALICFRFKPNNIDNEQTINSLNEKLLKNLNDSGIIYLSHTKLNGKYAIRFMIGQTNVEQKHIEKAWNLILIESNKIL